MVFLKKVLGLGLHKTKKNNFGRFHLLYVFFACFSLFALNRIKPLHFPTTDVRNMH